MNKVLLIFLLFLLTLIGITPYSLAQTIYIQGNISNDTIIDADTIKVTGDINVLNGITLSIVKGSYVEFQGSFKLNVLGRLLSIGEKYDTIYFTVNDTTGFSDTSAVNGGWHGIHFNNTANSNDTSRMIYCKIQFGKARGGTLSENSGGAIFIDNFSKVCISNSTICNNLTSRNGAGVYCGANSSPKLENCCFRNNRTYYFGGGIFIGANSNVKIIGNTFIGNIAYRKWQSLFPPYLVFSAGSGGAIYSSSPDINLYCPVILNNKLFNNNAISGGGIYESNYQIRIINNLICNNEGSGIFNGHQLGQGRYLNNTICNNSNFAGIECWSTPLDITDNILWGNTNLNGGSDQIIIHLNAVPSVQYCDIENGYNGVGNIDDFPLFVQPTSGAGLNYNGSEADWSLQHNSPCIDIGIQDTTSLKLPMTDIAGNPRISYFRIDIGAYEKLFATSLADMQFAEIRIFPNPIPDMLFLQTSIPEMLSFEIFDLMGKAVYVSKNIHKIATLDLSFLKSGLFIYRIKNQEKTIAFGKIIKI